MVLPGLRLGTEGCIVKSTAIFEGSYLGISFKNRYKLLIAIEDD